MSCEPHHVPPFQRRDSRVPVSDNAKPARFHPGGVFRERKKFKVLTRVGTMNRADWDRRRPRQMSQRFGFESVSAGSGVGPAAFERGKAQAAGVRAAFRTPVQAPNASEVSVAGLVDGADPIIFDPCEPLIFILTCRRS